MAFPLMAGALVGTTIVGGLVSYSNYKSTKQATDYAQDFYNGSYKENLRFWSDYRRAHHWNPRREIRYPYRTGYNYNLQGMYNAGVREVSAKNSVYRSIASGLVPVAMWRGSGHNPSRYVGMMYR